MLEQFDKFIKDNALFTQENRLLVALSGGMDSIVLCDLLLKAGYKFAVAHCNFHLRGEESDADAVFVKKYAEEHNIDQCFMKDFDTVSYMRQEKKSLEMAARQLRYDWFKELLDQYSFDYLVTGHHSDDSAETMFINMLRGTGISGLHGILPRSGQVVRPLLFASKAKIVQYAQKNDIQHIEDSSNQSIEIIRNRIRKEVFPIFREIAPNFDITIRREIERFRQTEQVFRTVIDKVRQNIIIYDKKGIVKIPIASLKELNPIKIFLFEIFSQYGFNEATINMIEDSLFEDISGKQFFSETFRAIRDREYIIINELMDEEVKEYAIEQQQTKIIEPLTLQMEVLRDLQFISIPKQKTIVMLDYDLLTFPLVLRKWKKGDSFVPFGSNKPKKLSDFFTNLKYSLWDKENQWLLCSGEDIIWVVGKRLDDRFKITSQTKTIYKIVLQ
ncbi:MAG: tRNA lysidine(34) synthetase TilS [Bacteroidales bacterium]|jgi:tRNA(Ile)-lysidine synthase|nr:tRNA lysidine(34) synthetase TilS [Bacteroidales bacterium]